MGFRPSSFVLAILWLTVALVTLPPAAAQEPAAPDEAGTYTGLQEKGFFLDAQGRPLAGGEAVTRYDIASFVARSLEMLNAARQTGTVRLLRGKGEGQSAEALMLELKSETSAIGSRLDRMLEGQAQLQKDVRELRARRARRR